MTSSTAEIIKAALSKYNAYDDDWERAYFDIQSGGYNVYHKEHRFSQVEGGGDAEVVVGHLLAKHSGKQVEFLAEGENKSPDYRFDGQTWDLKFINNANENTIRLYIKDARKADNVIFYYTTNKYLLLENAIVREVGKLKKENRQNELPNIYFIDDGKLKLLWGK